MVSGICTAKLGVAALALFTGMALCLLALAFGVPPAAAQEQTGGGVVAWGHNGAGQSTVPAGAQSGMKAIAGGYQHSLALRDDGSVVAWGDNSYGQTSVPASASSGVKAIAAGSGHSLALRDGGSVVAWGEDSLYHPFLTSVPAGAQSGVKAIAAGGYHSLALKDDGSVVAWGYNEDGQSTVPASASSGVKAISAGIFHSLALKEDGSVVVWGEDNVYTGLTNVPVSAQSGVKAIAAGEDHSLALKDDGSVVAWGYNSYGQSVVPASASSGVTAIAAGGSHSLALKEDGSVVAWGRNLAGQSTVPASAQSGVKAISAGRSHSLALDDVTPPAGVELFDAQAGEEQVSLSWVDPQDADFTATRVLRSTTGFATGPEPSATQSIAYEGTAEEFVDIDLQNATPYYYTAFASDGGNWSARDVAMATPRDSTAPAVTVVGPMGNKVRPTANVTATFSEAMDESTVEAAGVVTLRKGTGAPVAAAVDYDPSTKVATLDPSANLKRGARYKAVVSAGANVGAEDLAGNGLDQAPTLTGDQPKQWSFTVRR